jgi:hypothetical protein
VGLVITTLVEKLLEALLSVIIAQIISIYKFREIERTLVRMSWGGILIAIAAGLSSYLPHVDPHYSIILATVGSLVAAMGESIIGTVSATVTTAVPSVTAVTTKLP